MRNSAISNAKTFASKCTIVRVGDEQRPPRDKALAGTAFGNSGHIFVYNQENLKKANFLCRKGGIKGGKVIFKKSLHPLKGSNHNPALPSYNIVRRSTTALHALHYAIVLYLIN